MSQIPVLAEFAADVIDGIVIVLMVAGLLVLVFRSSKSLIQGEPAERVFLTLRLNLGQLILLALEVLIVSDILHSIAHRTLQDLGALAVIVVIRVTLAFFLDRELERLSRKER